MEQGRKEISAGPGRSWSSVYYAIFSAIVTLSVFAYLFAHVSLRDVVRIMRGADPRGIAMFVVLSLGMSVFRTWRYGLILGTSANSPGRLALFLVVLVRNLFSDLLPARIGTLVYLYIATTRLGIPFGAAASSFALSFLFDIISLAPMIVFAILWAGTGVGVSLHVLLIGGVALLGGSVTVLHMLPRMARWAGSVMQRARFLRETRRQRWSRALLDAEAELLEAKSAGIYGRLLILSLAVRAAKYASLYVLLFALVGPLGFGLDRLSVPKAFIGICSSELAASLPVSGIAGFGMYEGVWSVVFEFLGFPGRVAKLTSISHHLFTQVYGYSLGGVAMLVLLLPFFRRMGLPARDVEWGGRALTFYSRVVGMTAAMVLCAAGLYAALTPGRIEGPAGRAPERNARQERLLRRVARSGRILFDSNRGGNFGIFSMEADGSDVRVVIDSKAADIYPDPSPDGKWVVFARATSAHRLAPSEIWICRRDGKRAGKIAEDGTFPTFSSDGRTVYFERERKRVMAVGADGKNEREIFPRNDKAFSRHRIVKPRVSRDGLRLAFISDRGGGWNVWCVELRTGKSFHVGKGCEPAWYPDSRHVAWVTGGRSRQGAGLSRYDCRTGERIVVHDDGPPFGHEYFPTVSPGGSVILWGACPEGQHSHEDSNYQIFLKDLRNGVVVRVTYDRHNNRWPKIVANR